MFNLFHFGSRCSGLGLKMKEKEFINFTSLTNSKVSLKSLSVSPGYPIIKSLENFIEELIFLIC